MAAAKDASVAKMVVEMGSVLKAVLVRKRDPDMNWEAEKKPVLFVAGPPFRGGASP